MLTFIKTIPITSKNYVFFSALFGLMGLSLVVIMVIELVNTQKYIDSSVKTQGVVVQNIKQESSKNATYTPLIRFITKRGDFVESSLSESQSPPQFSVGQRVEVLYQTINPAKIMINSTFDLYFPSLIGGIISILFFVIAWLLMISKGKDIEI